MKLFAMNTMSWPWIWEGTMGASDIDNVVWMKMKGNDIITFQMKYKMYICLKGLVCDFSKMNYGYEDFSIDKI